MLKIFSKRKKPDLFTALAEGDIEAFKALLDRGADVHTSNRDGDTALMLASHQGLEEIVSTLIEKGADIDKRNLGGYTPLLFAANVGREGIVRILLENGARADTTNNSGDTPLILAATNGHEDVVRLLLDHQPPEPSGPDDQNEGEEPLESVEAEEPEKDGSTDTEEDPPDLFNHDNGLAVAKNEEGYTALMGAAKGGHTAIVDALLERETHVDLRGPNGYTALMLAAENGRTDVVEKLLGHGADPNLSGTDNPIAATADSDDGNEDAFFFRPRQRRDRPQGHRRRNRAYRCGSKRAFVRHFDSCGQRGRSRRPESKGPHRADVRGHVRPCGRCPGINPKERRYPCAKPRRTDRADPRRRQRAR